jgi:hypothetical protein
MPQSIPLTLSEISVYSISHVTVRLKQSKADPFGAGGTLHLGSTGNTLCPVAAVLGYLAQRPAGPGFLFLFRDGSTLSLPRLTQVLRCSSGDRGSGFHIGAATAAAQAGLSDSALGWEIFSSL